MSGSENVVRFPHGRKEWRVPDEVRTEIADGPKQRYEPYVESADQTATWDMDEAQVAVYAAERARERQLARQVGADTPDTTRPLSGPENEATTCSK